MAIWVEIKVGGVALDKARAGVVGGGLAELARVIVGGLAGLVGAIGMGLAGLVGTRAIVGGLAALAYTRARAIVEGLAALCLAAVCMHLCLDGLEVALGESKLRLGLGLGLG